jgi:TolB protein
VVVGPQPPPFNSELWRARPDGLGTKRVIRTKRIGISDPAWAPEGLRLAYVVVRDPLTGGRGSIFVADLNGTHRRRLTKGYAPAWSPDGRTIAFERTSTAGPAIWLMRTNGKILRRVTAGIDPAWSPDGRQLALSHDGWIYIVNRNGTGLRQVTSAPTDCDIPDPEEGGTDLDPDWAPDGRQIAFVRDCDELSAGTIDRIMTVGFDGTNLRQLTSGPDDSSPSWSPDGKLLAFIRTNTVESVSADGRHARRLFAPRRHEVYQVAWLRRRSARLALRFEFRATRAPRARASTTSRPPE